MRIKSIIKVATVAAVMMCSGVAWGATKTISSFGAAAGTGWSYAGSWGIYFALQSADGTNYAFFNNTTQADVRVTQLNSALPVGSVINGITITIKGWNASGGANGKIRVGLTKDGTTLAGTRVADVQLPTTNGFVTLGGAADLWGSTWTVNELNASTFGVLISDNDTVASQINLDQLQVVVDYTPPNIFGDANIGTAKTVRLVINGVDKGTTVTDTSGRFYFPDATVAGDAVLVYLDGDPTYKGAIVSVSNGSPLNLGYNDELAIGKITLTHATAGPITNAHIAQALGAFTDPELLVSMSGNDLTTTWDINVLSGKTYTPGGNTSSYRLTPAGVFNGGSYTHTTTENMLPTGTFNMETGSYYVGGTFSCQGTVNAQNTTAFVVNGHFRNGLRFSYNCTFNAPAGVLEVKGAFNANPTDGFENNNGSFNHNNGTVLLSGGNQYAYLKDTYNVTKTSAAGDTLYLHEDCNSCGDQQNTVYGKLTLKGQPGTPLKIRSNRNQVSLVLASGASKDISDVDVNQITVSASVQTLLPINAPGFIDSGSNYGWVGTLKGTAPGACTVRALVNGVDVGAVATKWITAPASSHVYEIDTPISSGDKVVLYIEGHATYKSHVVTRAAAAMSPLTLVNGEISLRKDDGGGPLTNADILAAIGSYSHADLLISGAGNNVIFSGTPTVVATSYSPGGDLTANAFKAISFTGGAGTHTYNGTFTLSGTYSASSGVTNFGGDMGWTGGSFIHNNGTVVMTGGNQTISGSYSWPFYGFTKNVATAATLTNSASSITFSGPVNLNGAEGQLLTLNGGSYNFMATATKTSLSYLEIKSATASSSAAAQVPINPTNSVINGSATYWFAQVLGNAYSDKGVTGVGIGKTIRFLLDGVDAGSTTTTNAAGAYNFYFTNPPVTDKANQRIFAFIEGDAVKGGAAIGVSATQSTSQNIWGGYLRLNNSLPSTNNATIVRAIGAYSSPDFSFSASGNDITTGLGIAPGGSTYIPTGNVEASSLAVDNFAVNPGGYNLTISGPLTLTTGTFWAGSGTHRFGSISHTGTGTYNATSGTTYVSGDISSSAGSFNHNGGTFVLDGTNQTISGLTMSFKNFTKRVTTADTLTLAAGIAFFGTVDMGGVDGQLLSLRSSVAGTQRAFSLAVGATKSISYVDVKDMNASGSAVALKPVNPANSINSGNNTGWFSFIIDAQIKAAADALFVGANTVEATANTQEYEQGVISGSPASFSLLFKNNGESADSIKITGLATGLGFTVQYLDDTATDRTADVIGAGYTIANLAAGASKTWTVNVTPAATVSGGTSRGIDITASSIGNPASVDQIRALVTSISAKITSVLTADKSAPVPGDDVILTVTATNPAGLSAAPDVVGQLPVSAGARFKVGSAGFSAGTSTLVGTPEYSNDGGSTWTYAPVSGGCSAPAGYDACVTAVQWQTTGTMPEGTSFSVGATVQIP